MECYSDWGGSKDIKSLAIQEGRHSEICDWRAWGGSIEGKSLVTQEGRHVINVMGVIEVGVKKVNIFLPKKEGTQLMWLGCWSDWSGNKDSAF